MSIPDPVSVDEKEIIVSEFVQAWLVGEREGVVGLVLSILTVWSARQAVQLVALSQTSPPSESATAPAVVVLMSVV